MANPLLEKMHRAREFQVPLNGHTFTARRPLDSELAEMNGSAAFDWVRKFVVGWDLQEIDLIPGGDPTPAPFDRDVWAEWIGGRSDDWGPLAKAIVDAYNLYEERRKDSAKNSLPG